VGRVDLSGYDVYAPFYDATQGDRAQHAAFVRSLIERHHPKAKTVLELACGTGSILKQLEPNYELVGVDQSEVMLALAAQKVPSARLVRADMTAVRLKEEFDVVLCVYDSINHLLRFAEWVAVFDRAREHVRDDGIFIFDINTQHKLATFADANRPWIQWFGDGNLVVGHFVGRGRGVVAWEIRVFEHVGGSDYRLHSEDIEEISFPVDRIKAALRRRFTRLSVLDTQRSRPSPRSERLHFVCRP
jgi:SAM-dependent methyltransferase